MQNLYDVIVVGAGPAGSTAARITAEAGLKTLLLDRRREVGVPVQCGEYLPSRREMKVMFPDAPRLQNLGRVSPEFITNNSDEMVLVSPRFKEYRFPIESNIIDRRRYDNYLAEMAQESGAELLLKHRVVAKTPENKLQITSPRGRKTYSAKIVIGADGPHSTIARFLGFAYPNTRKNISLSLQFVVKDIPVKLTQPMMFFGHRVAPGGYAWVIPKTEYIANIGLGLRSTYMRKGQSLSSYLHTLMASRNILDGTLSRGNIVSRVSASIPVGGPLKHTCTENAILIGDAAGHVMASNGGGIPTALAGGSIAGETVVQHFYDGSSIQRYDNIWKKEFGKQLYSALAILRIADIMMNTDSLTEVAMGLSGSRYLEDVIKCRVPSILSFGTPLLTRIMELV